METSKSRKGSSDYHDVKKRPTAKSLLFPILLIAASMGLASCVTFTDFEASQVNTSDVVGIVDGQTSLGQTFVARRVPLNGITIWLTPSSGEGNLSATAGENSLSLKLFHSPEEQTPIFTTTILAPATGSNLPVFISISGQNNQAGQSYYLQLTKQAGSFQINGRNENAYPHGQAYNNGNPLDADIAFRLSYDYGIAALGEDISRGLSSIWLVAPLLAMLWLPGWLLLEFSGLGKRFDFGEQAGLSIGISLALIPVLMLWTTLVKIRWTRSGILFLAGFLAAVFVIRVLYTLVVSKTRTHGPELDESTGLESTSIERKPHPAIPAITLLIIFLLTSAIRFIMVRDMATPAWVDSVHHALITRLILSAGAYPSSYLPFWDFPPAAYHPGFHSIVATFTWLTNLSLDRSMLIIGQILNALLVFPVYLLGKSLSGKSSVGLIAAIISGFITPMAAYYTSWGRYTELTGLLILPAAFVLIKALTKKQSNNQRAPFVILGAIASAGLFMVHYRVILFLACLCLSFLLVYRLGKTNLPLLPIRQALLWVAVVAAGGLAVVLPWLYEMVGEGALVPYFRASGSGSVPFFQDFSWTYLTAALGKQSLVMAGLGLVWGMIRRQYFPFMLAVWIFLLFTLANLGALHLPGGNLINHTSVEIMLFIPISILGGYLLEQVIASWRNYLPQQLNMPFLGIIVVIIGWAGFTGAKQLVTILNPVTILTREADIHGIEWVSENIPEDETIVVNPFAWGYGVFAGNDGGYWISPLAGRRTLPPPVLYARNSDRDKTNELTQKVFDLSSDPAGLREFLTSNQLRYIFIGARGGVLSPQQLSSSGLFTLLYQQDGVWIFAVKP